jgi:NADPH-dependent curcumin reductase CurA
MFVSFRSTEFGLASAETQVGDRDVNEGRNLRYFRRGAGTAANDSQPTIFYSQRQLQSVTVHRCNRQVLLSSRPDGVCDVAVFALRERSLPVPASGEVLVRSMYLSIDPWLRHLMDHPSLLPTETVVPGDVVGCVIESKHVCFCRGDIVQGVLGWQQYAAVPWYLLRKIDPTIAPISTALGVLGTSGLTAFVGLFGIGCIRAGDTVVVSAAAGAVGSVVAQLATLAGCRVIGIAGSEEKIRYLTHDLRLHAALDYKTDAQWRSRLAMHTPFGVDVYFDNVGGRVTEAVLPLLNAKARVVVCGQIASYDRQVRPSRFPWLGVVLEKRIRVEGFLVTDFADCFPSALQILTACWRAGLIRSRETIAYGLENAPHAFVAMLHGENIGKQLVKVD